MRVTAAVAISVSGDEAVSMFVSLSLRRQRIIYVPVCLVRVCVSARLCRCVSACRCVFMSVRARCCVSGDSTVVIFDGGQSQRQLTTASVVSVNETTDKSGARGTTAQCDCHQCGADGSGGKFGTTTGIGMVMLTVAAEVAASIFCDGSGGDFSLGSLCLCLSLSLRCQCIICASVCLRVCVGARLCRCVSACRCRCVTMQVCVCVLASIALGEVSVR